jgi:hypothetical protein
VNYRKKEILNIVTIPAGFIEGDRGSKCGTCCEDQVVLASSTSADSHKNDFTGVYMKKGVSGDTIAFTMEDCSGNVITNYGVDGDFPNDSLAVGYIFDWKEVLINEGIGKYNIIVSFNISGIPGGFTVGTYELKEFSRATSKDSVRIYSEFNSYYQKDDIDFTDSNFIDTVRFNGFFGNREPETEINNLINKGRKVTKVTRENLNKYTLTSDPLEIGMTNQLLDKHFINEDVIKISDYNRYNHNYDIFDQDVELVDTAKIEPIQFDRRSIITAVFGDKVLNDKSYYR